MRGFFLMNFIISILVLLSITMINSYFALDVDRFRSCEKGGRICKGYMGIFLWPLYLIPIALYAPFHAFSFFVGGWCGLRTTEENRKKRNAVFSHYLYFWVTLFYPLNWVVFGKNWRIGGNPLNIVYGILFIPAILQSAKSFNRWWSTGTYLTVVLSRKVLLAFTIFMTNLPKPYGAIVIAVVNMLYFLARKFWTPEEWNSVLISSLYIAKDDYKDEMDESDKKKFKNNYGIHFLFDSLLMVAEIALAIGSIVLQFSNGKVTVLGAIFEWFGYLLFVFGVVFCCYVVPFVVPQRVAKKVKFREEWDAAVPSIPVVAVHAHEITERDREMYRQRQQERRARIVPVETDEDIYV